MKKKILACMLCAFAFTCTPIASYISNTKTVFAVNSSFTTIYLETSNVKEITGSTNLSVFCIKDESGVVTQKDTIYALKLNNGFIFQNKPEIVTSGKYQDKVQFEIDYQNPAIAYITIQKQTDDTDGTIEFHNLDVAPSETSEIDKDVILSLSGNNTYDTIKVGTYKESPSSYKAEIKIQTLEASKKPSATGTATAGKKLQIRIDDEEYGDIMVSEDGTWNYVFPYKSSYLKEGIHTFSIGYLQGKNTWLSAVSQEFEILPEVPKTTATVTFTVGSNTYTYENKTGYLESPPFIDSNGRTLLPLRAVAGTLGIDTQNIQWDNANQTITISIPENKANQNKKIIRYKIGSHTITINDTTQEIDSTPVIQNGVTFLPLRTLLNSLGITDDNITWNADTYTVSYEAEKINS